MLSSLFNLLGAGVLGFGNSAVAGAYNAKEASKMRKFQAQQAQLQRDWMTEMSNTAHQREVDDLYQAGLNPILSATGGSGASVGTPTAPSGAMSHMDTPQSAAMLTALTSMIKSSAELDLVAAQADKLDAETNFINQQSETSAFNRMMDEKRYKFELARNEREFSSRDLDRSTQNVQFYETLRHQNLRLRTETEQFNLRSQNEMATQSARLRQEAQLARERMSNDLTRAWIQAGSNLLNGIGDGIKTFMLKGKR